MTTQTTAGGPVPFSSRVEKKTREVLGADSPTSTASTASLTPLKSTRNTDTTHTSAAPHLPEATQQPIIGNIRVSDPADSKPHSVGSNQRSRRGKEVSPWGDSGPSPRAIDMSVVQEEGGPPIPHTISGPTPSKQSHSRRHRRVQSDHVPERAFQPTGTSPSRAQMSHQPQYFYPRQQQQQAGPIMHQQPPEMMAYSPELNAYVPSGNTPPLHMPRGNVYNGQPVLGQRGRSWSGSGPPQHLPPHQLASTPPQALHPHGMPARNDRQPPVGATSGQVPRGSRRKDRHRKSRSSSAAMPGGYGSFWSGEVDPNMQQQPSLSSSRTVGAAPASPSFSPRSELMTLANTFRDPSEMSPRQSPRNQYRKSASNQDPRVTWSPGTPGGSNQRVLLSTPGGSVRNVYESPGGEPYLTQRRSKSESSRKMQLRQHSAQLFMEEVKGTEQPASCRDLIFLLLFVFHLMFMVYIGQIYGKDALQESQDEEIMADDDTVKIHYKSLVYLAGVSGAFAVVVSASLLAVMTFFARHFVQVALMFVCTISFVWGTVGIGLSPKTVVPITGVIALALSVAYTFIVWDRITFSATNLLTALNGVHAFPGTVGVAFIFQALALGWSVYYGIVLAGIYDAIQEDKLSLPPNMDICVYVLLGISYYWTFRVFSNVVQTATAGVIGHWWHAPEDEAVVRRSAFKTVFYSMGSICFGSLFVGPVSIIRFFCVLFRPHPDEASLMCIYECLHCIQSCVTSCVDTLADRFNPWAFTYIGLYGYGFLDAGLRATEVFEKRGWATIVSDDLVSNILLIASLVIGGITGCFAHVVDSMDLIHVLSLNEPGLVSFWIGSCVGFVVTSVLFSVISSAMNTVLVCFATTPVDFEMSHPELSHEMRAAWREVWPGALDIIDLHDAIDMRSPDDRENVRLLIP